MFLLYLVRSGSQVKRINLDIFILVSSSFNITSYIAFSLLLDYASRPHFSIVKTATTEVTLSSRICTYSFMYIRQKL